MLYLNLRYQRNLREIQTIQKPSVIYLASNLLRNAIAQIEDSKIVSFCLFYRKFDRNN